MTPEQNLFIAVLMQAIRDAFPLSITKSTEPNMFASWGWIGRHPSADFMEVCRAAQVEPSTAHSVLLTQLMKTPDERREFAKIIRSIDGVRSLRAAREHAA